MEKRAWILVVVTATVCTLMAIVAWSATIYAFVATPSVNEVVLSIPHHGTMTQSKAEMLFTGLALQTLFFFTAVSTFFQYKQIIKQSKIWGMSAPAAITVWCAALCIVNGLHLYIVMGRAHFVLQYGIQIKP